MSNKVWQNEDVILPADAQRWEDGVQAAAEGLTNLGQYVDQKHGQALAHTDDAVAAGMKSVREGNVASASKLETPRTIAGVAFDGTTDISIPANNVGAYSKTESDARFSGKSDKPYQVLFSGSKVYSDGTFKLSKSITLFRLLTVTVSFQGNRVSGTYQDYGSSTDIRLTGVNLNDNQSNTGWNLMESFLNIEGDTVVWQYAKNQTQSNQIISPSDDIKIVNIIGWY